MTHISMRRRAVSCVLFGAFGLFGLLSSAQQTSVVSGLYAQPTLTSERTLKGARALSEALRSLPPPSSEFEARRWSRLNEKRAQERAQKTAQGSSEDLEGSGTDNANTGGGGLLSALERYLPRRLLSDSGLGASKPQHLTQRELLNQTARLDEHTHLKAPLLTYTTVFMPSVFPMARERSFNALTSAGELKVQSSRRLHRPEVTLDEALTACFTAPTSRRPNLHKTLYVGAGQWLSPLELDMSCLEASCRRRGERCFMGTFELSGGEEQQGTLGARSLGEPISVSSVSPEQRLLLVKGSPKRVAPLISLAHDDAHNFYLTLKRALPSQSLSVLLTTPAHYFSGSWRFKKPVGETYQALSNVQEIQQNIALPKPIQREAEGLFSLLNISPATPYQEALFRLVSWHRDFSLGELNPEHSERSLYERLTRAQRGVCRHRSYAFFISARAVGLPTRFVTNTAHAFVEVLDAQGLWRRVNLGGEGPATRREVDERLKGARAQAPELLERDGLPQPTAFLNAHQTEQPASQQELEAFYRLSLSEQRALTAPSPQQLGSRADHNKGALKRARSQRGRPQASSRSTPSQASWPSSSVGASYGADGALDDYLSGEVEPWADEGAEGADEGAEGADERGVALGPPLRAFRGQTNPQQLKRRRARRKGGSAERSQGSQELPTAPHATSTAHCPPVARGSRARGKRGRGPVWSPTLTAPPAPSITLDHLSLHATLVRPIEGARCAWVEVRGEVKAHDGRSLTRAQRRALKGQLVSLTTHERGSPHALMDATFEPLDASRERALEGYARLDHRGRFWLLSRLPLSHPRGRYQLKVRLRVGEATQSAPVHEGVYKR